MKVPKCLFFSTCPEARAELKALTWGREEENIPVALHFRDLGGCHDTSLRGTALTQNALCAAAIAALKAAGRYGLDFDQRVEYVRVKALPMALYGVEISQPAGDRLAALTAACADFVLPRAAWTRSSTLVLTALGSDALLWPEGRILELRALAFRRACAKDARTGSLLRRTLEACCAAQARGTDTAAAREGRLQPAPPPGHPARPAWAVQPRPKGPFRLFLHSLHLAGAAIDAQAIIVQRDGPDIPLLGGPTSGSWRRSGPRRGGPPGQPSTGTGPSLPGSGAWT